MVRSEAEAFAHPAVVARLAGMAAEIDALRVLVAALEAESVALRDRLSVPPKTPENSSVPPARGFKADRAARRRAAKADGEPAPKRGPKPGHRGVSRSRVSSAVVDVIVRCRPETCGHCGHGLPAAGGHRRETQASHRVAAGAAGSLRSAALAGAMLSTAGRIVAAPRDALFTSAAAAAARAPACAADAGRFFAPAPATLKTVPQAGQRGTPWGVNRLQAGQVILA